MITQFDQEPITRPEVLELITYLKTGDRPESVNTYADLPSAVNNIGEKYFVNTTTGSILLGNKKNAGVYISDGTTWQLIEQSTYDDIDIAKANKTITISTSNGLTGGGDLSMNRVISHGATGLATSITNTNGNVIQSLTLDAFSGGHITAASSVNLDNRYILKNTAITGATKTKITYDSNGLVTAGADATTTDINEGTNQYFTQARARTSISLTNTGSSGASTYNNTTGVLNIPNYTLAGLGGQAQLNGIGFVKASGTTISYDNNTYLTANQSITLSGDILGTGTTAITTTLANSGATAGTYQNATTINPFTIDSKGRITLVGTAITIAPAFSSITSKPTTISGYGITDGVTLTGTQKLTNKSLDDNTTFIIDTTDNTKQAQFNLSNIATATTRTYNLPNVDGTIITTGDTGTVSNTMLAGSIADTKLNTISTAGKVANSATTATNANTANTIVSRDGSGNFIAGTITATLTGNASTATALQTARTINGVSFNGTANITIADNTKQPLNTNLTNIGALANTAGWLYNNGSGVFSYSSPTTSNVSEGTNLYYTNARAIASTLTNYASGAGTISATDTILTAIQKLNGNIGALTTGVSSVFGRTGAVVATEGDYSLNLLSDVVISTPTNGQFLKYNGTNWVNTTQAGTGITSLNALSSATQTFATDTTGTDFNISSATSTHTFNLPTASATNRGALSSTDWSIFNNKQNTISLTTVGDSGASSFASNVLNVPNYTITGLGGLPLTGGILTGQLISTSPNNTANNAGQIYLNGANGNRIDFNANGVDIPSFTTRSLGTKIVLYPGVSPTATDFAFGISAGTLWSSVSLTAHFFRWYAGTTNLMSLKGNGNLGINVADPAYKLDVSGTTRLNGEIAFGTDTWHKSVDGKNKFYFASNSATYFGSGDGFYAWRNTSDADSLVLQNDGEIRINQTFDGIGLTLPFGGRIYKKSGAGIVIRKESGNNDIQIENNDGSNAALVLTNLNGSLKRTYQLPSIGNTATWIKLGGVTGIPQNGHKVHIKLIMSYGFNAMISQLQTSDLFFQTSQGSNFQNGSTGAFYAAGYYTTQSVHATDAPNIIRVVQVSSTAYDFYIYTYPYTGNSHYDISYTNITWTHSGSTVTPTGNYIDLPKISRIPTFTGTLVNDASLLNLLEPIPYTSSITDSVFYSNASGNVTINHKGTYEISCQGMGYHSNSGSGMTLEYGIRRFRNGTPYGLIAYRARHIATNNTVQGSQSVCLSCIANLETNDVIKVYCYVIDGSSTNVFLLGGSVTNTLSIKRISD